MGRKYSGKLLLFGEYTVIIGSSALAVPLTSFSGKWSYNQAIDNQNLVDFAKFLSGFTDKNAVYFYIDQFLEDLKNGLYFESNIPQGYGAGSSGALCAAVFDVYCVNKSDIEGDIKKLKAAFVEMESYFHGTSSGLDPLVSFLDTSIYYKKGSFLKTIDINHDFNSTFSLIDTNIQRQTAPLVEMFLNNMKNVIYKESIELLINENEDAIKAYLSDDSTLLKESVLKISQIQFEYFKEMIPNSFIAQWKDGILSERHLLKLCGAGGGGFILRFVFDHG